MTKTPFLPASTLLAIADKYPTPFHLYDEEGIRANARALQATFAWNPDFTEYFAVKATPNPFILKILAAEGCGADCSSQAELILAERVGLRGERIMFTSNNTPAEEFRTARRLGAIINLDALEHLSFLEQAAGLPDLISFRYNPGRLKQGNAIIGQPEEAKFGLTRAQLFTAYRTARDRGVARFGLHAMVASNEREVAYFVETATLLFELVAELSQTLGIRFAWVNLGGGLGIPYRPHEAPIDLAALGTGIQYAYKRIIEAQGLAPLGVVMECGRFITGPCGGVVTRVRHIKEGYKTFVGVDATMADLMRPGMYGAYHHITVLGKEDEPAQERYDIIGSLCENNDKFAIDRPLPPIAASDLLLIHDTGAHGHAMGFNYNGKLRAAELLYRADNTVQPIRRAETLDDYFATLDFDLLSNFAV